MSGGRENGNAHWRGDTASSQQPVEVRGWGLGLGSGVEVWY